MRPRFILLLLTIPVVFACSRTEHPEVRSKRPSVFIISIDTLRADHLPAYGYKSVATPDIDALRADSILYSNAWSHVPLTLPSHVSILTGLLPPENGVRDNLGFRLDANAHRTLPQLLKGQGYETGAAVSAYVLRGETGLRDAFDFYDDAIASDPTQKAGDLQRPGLATEQIAEQWIGSRTNADLFFLLHLFEPHTPYDPPEPYRSRFSLPYDGEIATADAIVGKFIAFLKSKNLYDNSVVILLSDHGEGLGDHGEQEHGVFLYRETLHVPLLVKLPRGERRGSTDGSTAELIDIAPTVLSLAQVKTTASLHGRALLSSPPQSRDVYSETMYPRLHLGWSALRSLISANLHFIEAPTPELYDMARDPGEKQNVIASERRAYASLRQRLGEFPRGTATAGSISAEESAKLAALGYIGSSGSSEGPLPDPKEGIKALAPMQEAARAAADGHHDRAISLLRGVVEKNPQFTEAWSELAAQQELSGQVDAAIASYRQAIRNTPQLAPNLVIPLANLLLKSGRTEEAKKNAEVALQVNPAPAHEVLARIAFAGRDLSTAESEARAASTDRTVAGRAAMTLAQVLVVQRRLPEALDTLDRAAAEAESMQMPVERLQFARGDLLLLAGRRADAEEAFRKEIATFPMTIDAYANLAMLRAAAGDAPGCQAVIEQMVQRNPNRAAFTTAAQVYERIGDRTAAESMRRKAAAAR